MPTPILEPQPCAEQSAIMEQLGFTCHGSEHADRVSWTLTLNGDLPFIGITFDRRDDLQNSPVHAVSLIILQAFALGQKNRAQTIAKLLA